MFVRVSRDHLDPQTQLTRAAEMKHERTFCSADSLSIQPQYVWDMHLSATKRATGLDFKI